MRQPEVLLVLTLVVAVTSTDSAKGSAELAPTPNILERGYVQNATFYPRSCMDTPIRRSGVHTIHPQPGFGNPFEVYCDHDYNGGGWSVIQNRFDGSVLFYRGWNDYENGFGDLDGEHWLGLRKIFEMTNSKRHELVVVLEDKNGITAFAKYDYFVVGSAETKYKLLQLGAFSGNARDGLAYHLDKAFVTFDADPRGDSCARRLLAGYWYNNCYHSNLNGNYWSANDGMSWNPFRDKETLKKSRMMIRPVNLS